MKRSEFFKRLGFGAIGIVLAPEAVKALEKEKEITVNCTGTIRGKDINITSKVPLNPNSERWAILKPNGEENSILLKNFIANIETGYEYVGDSGGWKYLKPTGRKTQFIGNVNSEFLKHTYSKECELKFYVSNELLKCNVTINSFKFISKNIITLEMSLSGSLLMIT